MQMLAACEILVVPAVLVSAPSASVAAPKFVVGFTHKLAAPVAKSYLTTTKCVRLTAKLLVLNVG